MTTKHKIVLVVIITILVIPIIINEAKLRPKIKLINDVKSIVDKIEDYDYHGSTMEVLINNEYTINNKIYKIKGNGVIFLEDNYSVMLSRNGMCAMKMPYSDEIMFQEEVCPEYRLIDGEIEKVVR